jgi:pilus assembly protein Flp/PilA
MKKMWLRLRDESGQDLVEYGLLLVLVALVAIAVIGSVGNQVHNIFSNAAACLATPSACP